MKVTIQGPNLRDQTRGEFHVHTADCADNAKYGPGMPKGGEAYPMTIDAASRLTVEAFVYDFAPAESPGYTLGDWQDEFYFAPCTAGLPDSDIRTDRVAQ